MSRHEEDQGLRFKLEESEHGDGYRLSGLLDIDEIDQLSRQLSAIENQHEDPTALNWDLGAVEGMDTASALVLWESWGRRLPAQLQLEDRHRATFDRLAELDEADLDYRSKPHRATRGRTGPRALAVARGVLTVFGRLALDLLHVLRHPAEMPWKELSAACYRTGAAALPIVSIVGLLIGVVLSYLSSLQLREYGAESFLPLILGIGVVRELGPLLAAVVIAGRSGSAITAGIAAMRLTQELDALSALGVSHSLRLVLPRTLALAITLPLLVVCTDIAALLGGMLAGWIELDIGPLAFIQGLSKEVSIVHFHIGLLKAFVFGLAIGMIACFFGLEAGANTQSLSNATTRSVVLSISSIIVLDAIFAIIFKGVPG